MEQEGEEDGSNITEWTEIVCDDSLGAAKDREMGKH